MLIQYFPLDPLAIFSQSPSRKTTQHIQDLEHARKTLGVTHIEGTEEVDAVVHLGERSFRIRNIQLPQVSVDGNGKDGHIKTVALDLALLELGCDPGGQLDHGVPVDVAPLDFDVDE